MQSAMRTGAIILCGGKSSRMGRDKASLPFGPEQMLQRIVRLIGEVVPAEHTVVVAAVNQELPPLPPRIIIARDQVEYRGPLAGLATGFRTLAGHTPLDAVFASACDMPLLLPAFVQRMFDLIGTYDVVVPVDGEHHHALAAVYRPTVLPELESLLRADRLRPRFLFDRVRTREVPIDELCEVDPRLHSLANVNSQKDYRAALKVAGLPPPAER